MHDNPRPTEEEQQRSYAPAEATDDADGSED